MSAAPSVEPLSTTMTSRDASDAAARRERKQACRCARQFQLTMQTLTSNPPSALRITPSAAGASIGSVDILYSLARLTDGGQAADRLTHLFRRRSRSR